MRSPRGTRAAVTLGPPGVAAAMAGLLAAAGTLPACVEDLADAASGCSRDAPCATGEVCLASGSCCRPTSCEERGNPCAVATDDGCGSSAVCPCPAGESCGPDGSCGCTPPSCFEAGRAICPTATACGETIDCPCGSGTRCDAGLCVQERVVPCGYGLRQDATLGCLDGCPRGQWCTVDTTLGCERGVSGECHACDAQPGACGRLAQLECWSCVGTEACGSCVAPDSCGGGGVPDRCGCTPLSREELCAGRCGTMQNCGAPVECGGCASGSCHPTANSCVQELRPFCWGAPQRWDALDAQLPDWVRGGSVVDEGAQRWLYLVASWNHYRVRLDPSDGTTLLSAVEPVPTAGPPDQAAPPYDRTPIVRADGLELFYTSDLDSRADYRTYVVGRQSLADPWTADIREVQRGGAVTAAGFALLLPDHRTLLHSDLQAPPTTHIARRATTSPGDADFTDAGWVALEVPPGADGQYGGLAPGCDGVSITFSYSGGMGVVDIRDAEYVTLGPGVDEPIEGWQGGVAVPFEAPDCQTLYFSDERAMYFAHRVACQ